MKRIIWMVLWQVIYIILMIVAYSIPTLLGFDDIVGRQRNNHPFGGQATICLLIASLGFFIITYIFDGILDLDEYEQISIYTGIPYLIGVSGAVTILETLLVRVILTHNLSRHMSIFQFLIALLPTSAPRVRFLLVTITSMVVFIVPVVLAILLIGHFVGLRPALRGFMKEYRYAARILLIIQAAILVVIVIGLWVQKIKF